MEATVIRLWEPSVEDYEDVKDRQDTRQSSPIRILDLSVSSVVGEIAALKRDPAAVCLPNRSINAIKSVAESLQPPLPSPDGIRSYFAGSPIFFNWNLEQGKLWIDSNFGSGLHKSPASTITSGMDPALIESLRVVPNAFHDIFTQKTDSWQPLIDILEAETPRHHWRLCKLMLWEGLGPRIDMVGTSLANATGPERFEIPFAPLSPAEWAAASAGMRGLPHS
ncbi:hypothetical protein CF326_g8599 [Tilletia indica]|uniref:Uncharacterized protein n=1 Tax=Tilletia indica TaxID=43049 RepID=A0A177T962_9BASI|nr:hypothetical protein CF326_g8599 [Tilletia indica]KAE8239474.1 hypothetical protein A4X13_0g8185 [Tilletia indica]